MLIFKSSGRGVDAALLAWIAVVSLVLGTPGAPGRIAGAAEVSREPESGQAPDANVARSAFQLIEAWLRQGSVPETSDELPAFSGVVIELRFTGRPPMRASVMDGPGKGSSRMMVRAAREILDKVKESRKASDAFDEKTWALAVMGGSTLTMEFAGDLVPFRADTYDQVDLGISPGLMGVGTLAGERFDAVFPLAMIGAAMTPGSALRSTIATAVNDPKLPLPGVEGGSPGEIAASHGARYYKFRTAQVTQLSPSGQPIVLHRGQKVFEKSRLSMGEIESAAKAMASHLLSRLEALPEGVVLHDPTEGAAEKEGTYAQAMLAMIAVSRWRQVEGTSGVKVQDGTGTALARLTQSAVRQVIADADSEAKDEKPTGTIEAALLSVYLSGEGSAKEAMGGKAERIGAFLARRVRLGYDEAQDVYSKELHEAARGLVALSMVRLSRWPGSGVTEEKARKAVRCAFRGTTPATLGLQMPWLGWAELELSELGATRKGEIPSAVALQEMRDHLFSRVVSEDDAGEEDADIAGGIMGAAAGSVLPTWHTSRPTCFLGTMLRDERLTPKSTMGEEVRRVLGPVRFVRQLMVDDVVASQMGARGRDAIGAVRSAAWDRRLPPDATSFGLMLMTETVAGVRSR